MKLIIPDAVIDALKDKDYAALISAGFTEPQLDSFRAMWLDAEASDAKRGHISGDTSMRWVEPHRDFWSQISPEVGAAVVQMGGDVERCPWFMRVAATDTIPFSVPQVPLPMADQSDPDEVVIYRDAEWADWDDKPEFDFHAQPDGTLYVPMTLAALPVTLGAALSAGVAVVAAVPEQSAGD